VWTPLRGHGYAACSPGDPREVELSWGQWTEEARDRRLSSGKFCAQDSGVGWWVIAALVAVGWGAVERGCSYSRQLHQSDWLQCGEGRDRF